ncbi:hypothetical protein AlacWU_00446 [Aspergillus niger]|nr:hypothetical protein AlacWU_00446 [Aspergillus niger]
MDIGVGVGLFPAQHRKQMRQRHQEWPQNLALVGMNPSCLQKSATRIDYPGKTAYLRCTCCIVCSANRTQDHCICESKTSLDSKGTLLGATILAMEHNTTCWGV